MGKGDIQRPTLISEEERIIRWKYALGEYPDMTEAELQTKIVDIRKKTGKPSR